MGRGALSFLSTVLAVATSVGAFCTAALGAEFKLRYKWEEDKVYTYQYERKLNAAGEPGIGQVFASSLRISVLSTIGTNATLAVQGLGVRTATQFVTVDDAGRILGRKIHCVGHHLSERGQSMESYNNLIGAMGLYNAMLWEVPLIPVTLDERVKGACGDYWHCSLKTNTCVISIGYDGAPERVHTRVFDVVAGILREDFQTYGPETHHLILRSVEPLADEERTRLLEQYGALMEIDKFRYEALLPFLNAEDKMLRKRVFVELLSIKDRSLLPRIHAELTRTAVDGELRMLADMLLLDNVDLGEEWAVSRLLSESWPKVQPVDAVRYVARLKRLESLSALTLGDDREAWRKWFDRVHAVFPSLLGSTKEDLVRHVSHGDPWVRLFALRAVSERDDNDIRGFVERAASDEDEIVREYARNLLEKLKGDMLIRNRQIAPR